MGAFLQDIRYAIRQLLCCRGVSLVVMLTLALGIGASTAVLSIVDAAMLRPLPYPEPEQLVVIRVAIDQPDRPTPRLRWPSLDDVRRLQAADDMFSGVASATSSFDRPVARGPEPERVTVLTATEDYLPLHGVVPVLGRDLNRSDLAPDAPAVVLISHGYWQRRYGGAADVIGQTLRYGDTVATIVGVWHSSFQPTVVTDSNPTAPVDVIEPMVLDAERATFRTGGTTTHAYGRLRAGMTVEQAEARLVGRLDDEQGADGTMFQARARVTSRVDETTAASRSVVRMLTGAVALVWLLACVNVAGLLIALGADRERELAVRASLGAGRWRLVRQLLTESVALSLTGGLLGIGAAWLTLDALVAILPMTLEKASATLNRELLAAATAFSIVTGVAFGIVPALRQSSLSFSTVLARGSRGSGTSFSRRRGQVLIAAEVMLAVVLVAGAGLMIRSVWKLTAVDLGFDPERLITMRVVPLDLEPGAIRPYYDALLERLRASPGVESAGGAETFALETLTITTTVRSGDATSQAMWRQVLPGYLETLDLQLVDGRYLRASDTDGVVISETTANDLFGEERVAGRQIAHDETATGNRPFVPSPMTVVGVVRDFPQGGPEGRWMSSIFTPFNPSLSADSGMMFVVAPRGSAGGLAEQLRRAATSIGPSVLVEDLGPATTLYGDRIGRWKHRLALSTLLGGIGLALALVGVFSMTAFAVTRRWHEIGVRMALGARPGQVVGTMLRDTLWPVMLGTTVGLGLALLATRVLQRYLFQTEPNDPATMTGVVVTLVATTTVAAWVPARRAARVDPSEALRAQ